MAQGFSLVKRRQRAHRSGPTLRDWLFLLDPLNAHPVTLRSIRALPRYPTAGPGRASAQSAIDCKFKNAITVLLCNLQNYIYTVNYTTKEI